MSRSSARRAQTEPLVALAATATVALALAAYASVAPVAFPPSEERTVAEPTATRLVETLRVGGVVRPGRLDLASDAAPEGYQVRVTLRAADRTWRRGPEPPGGVERTSRHAPVWVNGSVRPGRVTVEAWS